MKIKLNRKLLGHSAGTILSLQEDANGIALDDFWRARIEDSKIDNCLEILSDAGPRLSDFPSTRKAKRDTSVGD